MLMKIKYIKIPRTQANIMLARKFITLDAYTRKEQRSKTTDAKVLPQEAGKGRAK